MVTVKLHAYSLSSKTEFYLVITTFIENTQYIEHTMAFVFRSQADPNPPRKTPGPAYYRPEKQPASAAPHSVPFNQASPRKIWTHNNNPGPGYYVGEQKTSNEQVVLESGTKVFTLKPALETFPFKSSSQRFKQVEEGGPGPGYYVLDQSKISQKKQISHQTTLQKYLQGVYRQQIGFSADDLGIFGEDGTAFDTHERRGEVMLKKKSEKKNIPFNSKVEREAKERPKTSIGPGYYNLIEESKPCQELSPNEKNRMKISQSLAKIKKSAPEFDIDHQAEELIDLDNILMLPKNHSSSSTFLKRSINQRKDQYFGSTVSRFLKTETEITPGPGNYQINPQNTSKADKHKKTQISFGRYVKPSNSEAGVFISPFVCKGTQQKSPIKRRQKPAESKSFGSKQPRFKESKQNMTNITNIEQNIHIGTMRKNQSMTKFKEDRLFKRKSCKNLIPQRVMCATNKMMFDERPLSYASKINTIQNKLGYKMQKNAPFSSQAPRFQQQSHQSIRVVEDIIAQSQNSTSNERKFKQSGRTNPRGILSSNCPRFIYPEPKDGISPCSYDPQKPGKKQFNKLFL